MDCLTIKLLSGESFTLSVSLDVTVATLKHQIHQHMGKGFEVARQRLTAQNGQRVDLSDNSRTLRQYGLTPASLVYLLITEPAMIQVFLKNEKGQTHTYDIQRDETVSQFKIKVQARESVPTDQQRLIFQGKQMEDGRKLMDYGVHSESTIYLTLRLRGGAPE